MATAATRFHLHICENAAAGLFRLGYWGPTKTAENERITELNQAHPGSANATHVNQPWTATGNNVPYRSKAAVKAAKARYRAQLVTAGAIFNGVSVFDFPSANAITPGANLIAFIQSNPL